MAKQNKSADIFEFLDAHPIYYKKIDYERFPRAYASIADKIPLRNVTQIIGTNGKGSTGRFLARIIMSAKKRSVNDKICAGQNFDTENFATQNSSNKNFTSQNFSVGHYTSPHVLRLNERIYRDGRDINNDEMRSVHEFLQAQLPAEFRGSLSYFEYMTLLAARHFAGCDYGVIEAGMGGEFDATTNFERELVLFTPIGIDHFGMLGSNIEEISQTKFKAMSKNAILSDEMNETSVAIAREIADEKGVKLNFASDFLSDDDKAEILKYVTKHKLAKFQISNLKLAVAAAKFWGLEFEISQILPLDLAGRAQKIAPNIIIDVGHNELAAQALASELDGQKFTLIYNAFADKDIKCVLSTLAPIISRAEIFDYPAPGRELGGEAITRALDELGIKWAKFDGRIRKNENYLAFGSFHLVENFLKFYHSEALASEN